MALVGYRNLAWLKARLLPADMGDEADYDSDLANIGLEVAARFDRFTGRVLRRTVGEVFETGADQESVVVSCYPIEEITACALVVNSVATNAAPSISGYHAKAGIVRFYGAPGGEGDLIRLTITGGFWCEDSGTMPAAATALPGDLLGAWVQQVRAVCEAENTFRSKGAQAPEKKTGSGISLADLTLLPGVQKTLQLYMRFS